MQVEGDSMRKKILLAVFVLFMLASPVFFRLLGDNYSLPGREVYSFLLHKSAWGIPFAGNIISNVPLFILLFLPLVVVLFSFLLLNLILNELGMKHDFRVVFLVVLSLSPLAQSLAFFAGVNMIVFPVFLLGFLFLLKKRVVLGSALLVFASFLSPAQALVSVLVVFVVKKYWFDDRRLNFVAGLIGGIFLVFHSGFLFSLPDVFANIDFSDFFSEFGSFFGFGIFEIFLAGFGFFSLLRFRKDYSLVIYLFSGILILSFFIVGLRIYSLLIISFLNALIICEIFKRKWHVAVLKNLVLLTIFCGLLFASMSHAITLSKAEPSSKFVKGLTVLSDKKPGVVLTLQEYGDFVEFYSGKLPVVRGESVSSGLFSDYLNMFYSSDFSETLKLMKKYGVRYVIITPEMKNGKVWKKDGEGLVFLVEYDKHFKKLIENEGVAVWEVQYEE